MKIEAEVADVDGTIFIEEIDNADDNATALIFNEKENSNSIKPSSVCTTQHEDKLQNNNFDIGNYVGKSIDNLLKRKLLLDPWIPPKNYIFSYSCHMKKGKEEKRFASLKYLDQFSWLIFSDVQKGYFCKYCPFLCNICNSACGGFAKNKLLQKLVKEPLRTFAKLLGKDGGLVKHENCHYHKDAVLAAHEFLKSVENPEDNIINMVNKDRLKQVKENRERLISILKCIIVLGQQDIPFRGHRDDGLLIDDGSLNQGNFRALLQFKIESGDHTLELHLKNCSSRATYISRTTQNELINCCGDEILDTIISQAQKAKFYSLEFDETTDISHIFQLTLILRYIYENDIREDFIKFIDLHDEVNNMLSNEGIEYLETKITATILLIKIKQFWKEFLLV